MNKHRLLTMLTIPFAFSAMSLFAQEPKYPPLSEYLMSEDAEIALAKSAAPQDISDRATIEALTPSGFRVVRQGDNGFVCIVMRGFTGAPTFTPVQMRGLVYDPKTRAPIRLNPQAASRRVVPGVLFSTVRLWSGYLFSRGKRIRKEIRGLPSPDGLVGVHLP